LVLGIANFLLKTTIIRKKEGKFLVKTAIFRKKDGILVLEEAIFHEKDTNFPLLYGKLG